MSFGKRAVRADAGTEPLFDAPYLTERIRRHVMSNDEAEKVVAVVDVARHVASEALPLSALIDWRQINDAIVRRWSESGLLYVKRAAWRYVRKNDGWMP